MNTMKLSELFFGMKEYFQPEWAGRILADVEFRISGKEAGVFTMSFKNGELEIREGKPDKPDVVVSCDTEVMRDILSGSTSSLGAFMDDKIHVEGDMTIGMAVTQVFKSGRFFSKEDKSGLLEIVDRN